MVIERPLGKRKAIIRWRSVTLLLLFCFIFCGKRNQEIEKTSESGVEVVIKHLEPYRIKGEAAALEVEEELVLDLESEEIVSLREKPSGYKELVVSRLIWTK